MSKGAGSGTLGPGARSVHLGELGHGGNARHTTPGQWGQLSKSTGLGVLVQGGSSLCPGRPRVKVVEQAGHWSTDVCVV